jgi:hypothetical protein
MDESGVTLLDEGMISVEVQLRREWQGFVPSMVGWLFAKGN